MSALGATVADMSTTEQTRTVAERYFATMNARDWTDFSALLTDDIRYELPQTGEQITGREAYLRFNQEYPGDWQLRVTRLIATAPPRQPHCSSRSVSSSWSRWCSWSCATG